MLHDNAPDAYTEIRKTSGGVYDNVYEMQEIWKSLGGALDGIRDNNKNALNSQFVLLADAPTISALEAWLRIPTDPTKPLEERRAVVAAMMRGFGHIGEREIVDYVGLFTTGSVGVTFSVGGIIDVTITRDVEDTVNIADAYYVLGKRIPAHLTLNFHDNILPVTIVTVERLFLYSISEGRPAYFDGTHNFDGAINFSGLDIISTEYMEDDMASTITTKRMELLAQASRGDIPSLPPITHVAFGDGGAVNGRPVEPDPAQTALNNELGRYPIDGTEIPQPNVTRYTASIPAGELGGAEISEAGLIDADGNLVAVKNMPPKTKDEGLQLAYSFDDTFLGG